MNNKKIIQPKTKDELKQIIEEEIKLNGYECDLNHIDTSLITDMSLIFANSNFNGDLSQWNVSNVINMSKMFYLSEFNRDLSQWNVSNVINMQAMFTHSKFNGDLSKWKSINVLNSYAMFYNSSCSIPYWYDEDPDQIRFKLKEKQVKDLEEKLNKKDKIIENKKVKI